MSSRHEELAAAASHAGVRSTLELVAFFIATYAVTWGLMAPLVLSGAGSGPLSPSAIALFLGGSISPTLVAVALTLVVEGRTGLKGLLKQAGLWRFSLRLYLVSLGLPALLAVVALGIGLLIEPIHLGLNVLAVGAALFPIAPLGEEFGWRGYALPRLLDRCSPLAASLVVGVIWGIWHLPIFLIQGIYPSPLWASFALFVIVVIADSMFIGWVYDRTRGSLLSALLFHQGIRTAALVPMGLTLGAYATFALVHASAAIVISRDMAGHKGVRVESRLESATHGI